MNFKYLVIISFLFIFLGSSAFRKNQDNNKTIVWNKVSHNFGTINQGELMEAEFTFQNTGNDTLKIENVMGSCGCIATLWPKQSILPKDNGKITVRFDSNGKSGQHLKSITVYTNLGAYYLEIKALIIKAEKK